MVRFNVGIVSSLIIGQPYWDSSNPEGCSASRLLSCCSIEDNPSNGIDDDSLLLTALSAGSNQVVIQSKTRYTYKPIDPDTPLCHGETPEVVCIRYQNSKSLCVFPACDNLAYYNYRGLRGRFYCKEHKLDKMVNKDYKYPCIVTNCDKEAYYNNSHEKKPTYCCVHRKKDMINLVNKRKCGKEGCIKIPCYNYSHIKEGAYCAHHKLKDMVNIHVKLCTKDGCTKKACYNVPTIKKGIYCDTHKLKGMIDVLSLRCKTEGCDIQVRGKVNDGYCVHCYLKLHPEKKTTRRNHRVKEFSVVKFVKENFPEIGWVHNKRLNVGNTKYRPDLQYEFDTHILLIEIDENQHVAYDHGYDDERVNGISANTKQKPIVIIRFNPDYYRIDGKSISSCWVKNEQGIASIKDDKVDEWNDRLNTLKHHISNWIGNDVTIRSYVDVVYLFFHQ